MISLYNASQNLAFQVPILIRVDPLAESETLGEVRIKSVNTVIRSYMAYLQAHQVLIPRDKIHRL